MMINQLWFWLLFLVVSASHAQTEFKLTASDAAAADRFGWSVAISGDTTIVGAQADDGGGTDSGSAYIFVWDGTSWVEQQKLTGSDVASFEFAQFGWSVAISKHTVIVGAQGKDDDGPNSGAAYVFEHIGDSWIEQQKLTGSDASASDQFGNSVAISRNLIIVGADQDANNAGVTSGAAYIFERIGGSWTEQQKLTASDGANFDHFGDAVAIIRKVAIVGARGPDGGGQAGAAYIFERIGGSWIEQQKLTASDAAAGDRFGEAVAISRKVAIVGAFRNGISGATYIFERIGGSWIEQQKLTASDGAAGDQFGHSVSISGHTVVVGNDNLFSPGAAYIFSDSGGVWTEQAKLTASDGTVRNGFGFSVAINANAIIVGVPFDSDAGGNSGAAYVYTPGPGTAPVQIRPVEIPNRSRFNLSALPKETRIFQNRPNPFNPETWIPYQLADDAFVSITIYDSRGQPVRALELGIQPAGLYLTKDRAAYWDGRSDTGEPVSSGVYFYTFQTGDFAATKKMLSVK